MQITLLPGAEALVDDASYLSVGFEDLYRREYPGLVGVATVLTGDRDEGEELAQDTMVKAFVHWRRVSGLQRPGAWCHRVLTNACRSRRRRRRTEERFLVRQRSGPSTGAATGEIGAFWDVVRTLPIRPRTVVALYFVGEYTSAEIARILDVPEGTVRSDIARARVVVMRALAD